MKQIMTLAIVAVVASVATPPIIQHFSKKPTTDSQDNNVDIAGRVDRVAALQNEPQTKPRKASNPYEGRKAVLTAASNGHFYTTARLNRLPVEVLVDTGATSVAMDEDVARRLGIRLKESDFKYESSTANGITKVAISNLEEISIGRVIVRDVKVVIIKRGKLDVVLLGMSFLSKLKSFEVTNGELVLKQ